MQKYKILVVDDETDIVEIVSVILSSQWYKVITALKGEEGLIKANKERPDLILLDITMPDMNGYDVCAKLKDNKDTKKIPVIMLTGQSGHDTIAKAHTVGADDYILKPFTMTTLLNKVSECLAKHKVKARRQSEGVELCPQTGENQLKRSVDQKPWYRKLF
jgi:DNA-binding response OmpR family regulator